jgi:hypothetical protein
MKYVVVGLLVALIAAGCRDGNGNTPSATEPSAVTTASSTSTVAPSAVARATTVLTPSTTLAPTTTSTPPTTYVSAEDACSDPDARPVDVDGDGHKEMVAVVFSGLSNVVEICSGTVVASVDMGGPNDLLGFYGAFDIDGDGWLELLLTASTGPGYVIPVVTWNGGEPVAAGGVLTLYLPPYEGPQFGGAGFTCEPVGSAAAGLNSLTLDPDGANVKPGQDITVGVSHVELVDDALIETPADVLTLSIDDAANLWGSYEDCFGT